LDVTETRSSSTPKRRVRNARKKRHDEHRIAAARERASVPLRFEPSIARAARSNLCADPLSVVSGVPPGATRAVPS